MSASAGITIVPMGGLGNQLFIYAAGLEQAQRLNCPLLVNTSWFSQQGKRRFELRTFRGETFEVDRPRPLPTHRLRRFVPSLYLERSSKYSPEIARVRPGFTLFGYFQSWRYFTNVSHLVESRVRSLERPSSWFLEMTDRLGKEQPWIAIHIRRGDYLGTVETAYHGVLSNDYYRRATTLASTYSGIEKCFIFSDDPASVNVEYSEAFLDLRTEVVESPTESDPIESLLLMSQGHAHVLANSSFSWWAAWLARQSSRITVVPRPWFRQDPLIERDLLPAHWASVGA